MSYKRYFAYKICYPKGPEIEGMTCDPHDHHFLTVKLQKIPSYFWSEIWDQYSERYRALGRRDANLYILDLCDLAENASVKLASNDDEICHLAALRASTCCKIAEANSSPLKALDEFSDHLEINPPMNGTKLSP